MSKASVATGVPAAMGRKPVMGPSASKISNMLAKYKPTVLFHVEDVDEARKEIVVFDALRVDDDLVGPAFVDVYMLDKKTLTKRSELPVVVRDALFFPHVAKNKLGKYMMRIEAAMDKNISIHLKKRADGQAVGAVWAKMIIGGMECRVRAITADLRGSGNGAPDFLVVHGTFKKDKVEQVITDRIDVRDAASKLMPGVLGQIASSFF